ncbi:hypothetical protein EYZ11_012608 [Aspergillus tanneri]|uniref:Uncharacterized protein n=1 Tax=Aspergillus tanneri TaxID=1220188 RepID=A0A4S3IZS2_9EURO|nr:hypothetical protein EYZ11_012608 [Aspergillus tanneri]
MTYTHEMTDVPVGLSLLHALHLIRDVWEIYGPYTGIDV